MELCFQCRVRVTGKGSPGWGWSEHRPTPHWAPEGLETVRLGGKDGVRSWGAGGIPPEETPRAE